MARMTGEHRHSIHVRRALWDQLWDRLLAPPRAEPSTPEQVPTPEEIANPEPRSRGEREQ